MTFDNLMALLSTQIFPIASCVMLMWYIKYITDKYTDLIKSDLGQLNQSMIEVKDTIDTIKKIS